MGSDADRACAHVITVCAQYVLFQNSFCILALRKTMVRAHRQAWCWQDEYFGLTMEDIRRLERETQMALKEKMAHADEGWDADGDTETSPPSTAGVEVNGRVFC
jgi:hypothetical protein